MNVGYINELEKKRDVKALINALRDSDMHVRASAATALGKLKDMRATKPLINALNDRNEYVRCDVVWALGEIKDPEAVKPLIKELENSNKRIREYAVWALGEIKDPEAVKPLINALDDSSGWLRADAANALGKIKDPGAVKPLIKTLKDSDTRVRCGAAFALGEIKDTGSVEPLINALKDDDADVRDSAAFALGEIRNPEVVDPLINALKDGNANVRRRASDALIKVKDSRAIYPLINALKDDDLWVRSSASLALEQIKDQRVVKPLINALKDDNAWVRANAAKLLVKFKDPGAIEPLINALMDSDEHVRMYAGAAIAGEADQLYQNKNYKNALNLYNAIIERPIYTSKDEKATYYYIKISKCNEKLRDLRKAKSALKKALEFTGEKATKTFIEGSITILDVKMGNEKTDSLRDILHKFADAEFNIPENLKDILDENEKFAKESEESADKEPDMENLKIYSHLSTEKQKLLYKLDLLEIEKNSGEITDSEYRFRKKTNTENLNTLNEKITEIEENMQRIGISKDEIQARKELKENQDIIFRFEDKLKSIRDELKEKKEVKEIHEKEIRELRKRIESLKLLKEKKAELDEQLKQEQDIISWFENELENYEQQIKAKNDELKELQKQIESVKKLAGQKAELEPEKQKIQKELKELETERNLGKIGDYKYDFLKKTHTDNLDLLNSMISDIEEKMQKSGKEEIRLEKELKQKQVLISGFEEKAGDIKKKIKEEKQEKQKHEEELREIRHRIESSENIAKYKPDPDEELKQKQVLISGFEDKLERYEQQIKAKNEELLAISRQVESAKVPADYKAGYGAEISLEKQKILDNLNKLESDRASGSMGRHSYEFWKKRYNEQLNAIDEGELKKQKRIDYSVPDEKITPEEELMRRWFSGEFGIIEYEKRLRKLKSAPGFSES
ncbi:hypothetical protein BEH94_02840 [Candidatus Altiarchaeales archaeon WOR_SM1_SCG]|nr:hypothetical protein BEH94_02840 [Candidatus Altiarchaeales archaeon WOR_SM1_SCG]